MIVLSLGNSNLMLQINSDKQPALCDMYIIILNLHQRKKRYLPMKVEYIYVQVITTI